MEITPLSGIAYIHNSIKLCFFKYSNVINFNKRMTQKHKNTECPPIRSRRDSTQVTICIILQL